jgi:DNA-directed RNA polymerase specialized sigma24 family protein
MTDQVDHAASEVAPEPDPLVLLALRTMPRLPFLCIKLHAGRAYDVARIARRLGISEARVVRNLKRAVLHTERVLHGHRRR